MDVLVLLAWTGAIGAGITIWGAIKRRRTSDEDWMHDSDLTAEEVQLILGRLSYTTPTKVIGFVLDEDQDEIDSATAAYLRNIRVHWGIDSEEKPNKKLAKSKPAPAYFRGLTSGLPQELRVYQEELAQFVEDGVTDRLAAGERTKPFVLTQAFSIALTIVKARLKLSIIRRWT